jgi:Protein of unknown function (DUF4231)
MAQPEAHVNASAGAVRPVEAPDPIMGRLDDQIAWYSRAATRNRRGHWGLRLGSITMAAAVPLSATLQDASWVPAILGAGIVVVEGAHELLGLQQNWTSFRATAEALKHEKYLYLADAGPYRKAGDAHALLAERVESLVSTETSQWVAIQQSQHERSSSSGSKDE